MQVDRCYYCDAILPPERQTTCGYECSKAFHGVTKYWDVDEKKLQRRTAAKKAARTRRQRERV